MTPLSGRLLLPFFRRKVSTMQTDNLRNPLVLSLATWAWGADPSPNVSPTCCVDSLPFLSMPCLSRLAAKGTGIAIILASCISKAPVIRNILTLRCVEGLSMASIYGDIIVYSNAVFYSVLRGNPFTCYGECCSALLQAMVVVALLWHYKPELGRKDALLALAGYCLYLFVVFRVLDWSTALSYLDPLFFFCTRGAQVIENYRNRQTGAQSIATLSLNLSKSLVRIATTIKEVGMDFHMLRGYGASVFFNTVLCIQILMYRKHTEMFLEQKLNSMKVD